MEHTSGRVCKEALDTAVADGLQVAGDASNGASGATGTGKSIDVAARLVPNLGTSRLDMRTAVGNVVKLVRPDGIVEALGVSLGLVVVVLGVVKGDSGHRIDLGSEEA